VDRRAPPIVKVCFDKVLAFVLLGLTAPVSIAIAIAILIEGLLHPPAWGPVLHNEVRVSAGRSFTLYKFRILTRFGEAAIRAGSVPKDIENNPANLTKVGALLKKIGLDELAQLLNIARGDMSFVGPRPKPPVEFEDEIRRGHTYRAQLRAGLSGPVQVMKGTVRTGEEEVEADFAYADLVESGSAAKILIFDIGTLWQTLRVLLRATGE